MSAPVLVKQPEPGESRRVVQQASDYCPICSRPLEPHGCKLLCLLCGYYMSCSDFC